MRVKVGPDLLSVSKLSFDAGLVGTTLDIDTGYRFARGEKVVSNTGQPVQLIRPLDFLAITDHAEMIGFAPMLRAGDPRLLADPWGRWAYERFNAGQEGRMGPFQNIIKIRALCPTAKNGYTERLSRVQREARVIESLCAPWDFRGPRWRRGLETVVFQSPKPLQPRRLAMAPRSIRF